jgi:hypothetical protein
MEDYPLDDLGDGRWLKGVFGRAKVMMGQKMTGHEAVDTRKRMEEDCQKKVEAQRMSRAGDMFVPLNGSPPGRIRTNYLDLWVLDYAHDQSLMMEDWVMLVSILID